MSIHKATQFDKLWEDGGLSEEQTKKKGAAEDVMEEE